jgi:proteic killer suppression protein
MILSFGDRETEDLFHGRLRGASAFPSDILRAAVRKLDMLHAATQLLDLRSPPGNRLEALRGDRRGLHSIRVNDQCASSSVGRTRGRRTFVCSITTDPSNRHDS